MPTLRGKNNYCLRLSRLFQHKTMEDIYTYIYIYMKIGKSGKTVKRTMIQNKTVEKESTIPK